MKYWIVGIIVVVLGFVGLHSIGDLAQPELQKVESARFTSLDQVEPGAMREVKAAMERGDVMGYVIWAVWGNALGNEEMVEKGLEFFRTSDTANAALMLYLHETRYASGLKSPPRGANPFDNDLEFAVLAYRAAMEDLDEPGRGDEVNAHLRTHRKENIANLYEKADAGDEWSQKIVAALEES